jgi:hypothetical protein
MDKNRKTSEVSYNRIEVSESREIVTKLFPLSSSETLNAVLEQDDPGRFIKSMTRVDLFWLMKKIGEDDALPVLRLASDDQWQYILDMEIWQKDSINNVQTFKWLSRLFRANPSRLSRWLYSHDGSLLAHYYFFRALQVEVKDPDEESDFPEGFFTIDNIYYIKILDKENEEVIEQILRRLAQDDNNRYQALLLGLAGVIPDEVEEEMYRLHNVRLAEEGYLPFEEAVSAYSFENPDNLKPDESPYKLFPHDDETDSLVPVIPFINAEGNRFLTRSLEKVSDNIFLDRLRMEFAGLCNQVFSADEIKFEDLNVLIKICRKTSGYIGIGLEQLAKGDIELSLRYLKNNPLLSIFRVGFGLALEQKWKAVRWAEEAWSTKQGLLSDFWGDEWGGFLSGLMRDKPLFYNVRKDKAEYRDYESIDEIKIVGIVLERVILLDRLFQEISLNSDLKIDRFKEDNINFLPVLFTFWACKKLNPDKDFGALSFEQVKDFFKLLRKGEKHAPYRMSGSDLNLISDLMPYISDFDKEALDSLKEVLNLLWGEFVDEYAEIEVSDLDYRFIRFFLIEPVV